MYLYIVTYVTIIIIKWAVDLRQHGEESVGMEREARKRYKYSAHILNKNSKAKIITALSKYGHKDFHKLKGILVYVLSSGKTRAIYKKTDLKKKRERDRRRRRQMTNAGGQCRLQAARTTGDWRGSRQCRLQGPACNKSPHDN